jgi:hypothetical protein
MSDDGDHKHEKKKEKEKKQDRSVRNLSFEEAIQLCFFITIGWNTYKKI